MSYTLEVQSEILAICRLPPESEVPGWASGGGFLSITRTNDELSIVCPQAAVPVDVRADRDWRCLKVAGPLDLALTGVLASLTNPLAEACINIFAISTFETDYLMIKEENLERAIGVLTESGHRVVGPE